MNRKSNSRRWVRLGCGMLLPGLVMLLIACDSTTVLNVNFTSNTVGSPPALTQEVGRLTLEPGAGTITVVDRPTTGLSANWVRLSHPTEISPQTAMTARMSGTGREGRYGFLAQLFIPSGTGMVTVQFEPFSTRDDSYTWFLHLDFMPEGNVRVDEGPMTFGRFPRDRAFTLSVGLNLTAASATAKISLAGPGASGSTDVTINPRLRSFATQFAAVKFWMGFQHTGTFYVDGVFVTRKND